MDLKDIKQQGDLVDKVETVFNNTEKNTATNPISGDIPRIDSIPVITNEQALNAMRYAYSMLNAQLAGRSEMTLEERYDLYQRADAFNKASTNMVIAIRDSYTEQRKDREYALNVENMKVRKLQAVNDLIKATKGDANKALFIIDKMSSVTNDEIKMIENKSNEVTENGFIAEHNEFRRDT